ncbi:ABC transporter permease [Streptococcus merionis]|uniref:Membrane protein n=1 Tax=Streptococcus merionis TaxID=400065 RepID=A0A239SPW0_9STRE|nr:ABC transporter permease [Streptococcus merionis]SNU87511.1 membrane protein [Streptococcus merionis]
MFNELKRYFNYRFRYFFDSICDILYSVIFIIGIMVIFDRKEPINLLYFFIYYAITNVILLANEELEYEIRTNQYANIKTTKRSPLVIYISRSVTYFIWTTLVFLISIILSLLFLKVRFVLPSLTLVDLIIISILNYIMFLTLYTLSIKMTERFERISVFLNLVNTVLLFYSGLVFPTPFITYVDLLDFILSK